MVKFPKHLLTQDERKVVQQRCTTFQMTYNTRRSRVGKTDTYCNISIIMHIILTLKWWSEVGVCFIHT